MRGIFQNAGQNCIGIERLLVHVDQYDELHALLSERAARLRVGAVMAQSPEGHLPTVDVGAMINDRNFEHLRGVMDDAVAGHATLDVGGGPYTHPYHEHGAYFTPTVVGDPHPDSRIVKEEVFAPIATLITYESVDEAIALANGTRYGLGASVFGTHQDECYKVAKRLDVGMVAVNDFAVFYVRLYRVLLHMATDMPRSSSRRNMTLHRSVY
jgi:acyl-CoA reductase-like NAD-dependent aldehyde dehydrogenase